MTFNFLSIINKNQIPLIKDKSNAIPILLSDNEDYLSNYLSNIDLKYAYTIGYFSSRINTLLVPDGLGNLKFVLIKPATSERFATGERIANLPAGKYYLKSDLPEDFTFEITLGFCLSSYRFPKIFGNTEDFDVLLCISDNLDQKKIKAFIRSEFLVRNLINMPASDLGPTSFENMIKLFAEEKGTTFDSIIGEELIQKNFPMIYTVGRAGAEAPRLVELNWGSSEHFKVTLVGKGVCFDTGGLNIKPGSSMSKMKKDMGGAASILGLAECIISLNLKVSLKILIPIVENSISSQSYRPGDILLSRKGLTVEVNNTDAEGRLILADTLHYADQENADLLVCMATLTGAARVALGSDIVPFYTNDDRFANTLIGCSKSICDPVWRLPFHNEYEHMIQPSVADLDNAPRSGMAGSITAALFLKRFVENASVFVHCDIFSWSDKKQPGRPVGAVMQGVRALFTALELKLKNC